MRVAIGGIHTECSTYSPVLMQGEDFRILRNGDLSKLICVDPDHEIRGRKHGMRAAVISCLYPVADGGEGLRRALEDVRTKVSQAIRNGARIIVLSDRESNEWLAPIPSLLSTAAVHHHLVRERTRTQVGLVVESGDAREVHHFAALAGYGAEAINPYLAFETLGSMLGTSGFFLISGLVVAGIAWLVIRIEGHLANARGTEAPQ